MGTKFGSSFMKFEPVKLRADETVVVTPKIKEKAPFVPGSDHRSNWRGGGLKQAERRLEVARAVYKFLYSLGEAQNPYLKALNRWNWRSVKTIAREFKGKYVKSEIQTALDWMVADRVVFYAKSIVVFYSISPPVRHDLLLEDE